MDKGESTVYAFFTIPQQPTRSLLLANKQGRIGSSWAIAVGLLCCCLWLLQSIPPPSVTAEIDNLCNEPKATIPTSPLQLTMRQAATSSFSIQLCTVPTDIVAITFEMTPTNHLALDPVSTTLSTMDVSEITIIPRLESITQTTHVVTVTIQPQASSEDENYHNRQIMPIVVRIDNSSRMFLPIIHKSMPTTTPLPTPTVTPAPLWQRGSQAGQVVDTLAIQSPFLYLGDRREGNNGGGIYQASLSNQACDTLPLTFAAPLRAGVILDLAFEGTSGLAAAFQERIYASADGSSWASVGLNIDPPAYAVVFATPTRAFAGTDAGVYRSDDSGMNWEFLTNSPRNINTLYRQDNWIWVGTFQNGVYRFDSTPDAPTFMPVGNLAGGASEVWQILPDPDPTKQAYYLATSDGIYRGTENGQWQRVGSFNTAAYSLEIQAPYLYAGLNGGGVHRALLAQLSDWSPVTNGASWNATSTVRDLRYDATYCKGLLAATNDGLWVLR